MSWFSQIFNLVQHSRDVVVTPHYVENDDRSKKATMTEGFWTNPAYGSPRDIDYVNLAEYEKDITVQAAINFIIDSVATSEWHVVKDEEMKLNDVEVDNTAATAFFKAKDWEVSFESTLRGLIADILLYDCGVLVKEFPSFCYDENRALVKDNVPPLRLRARDGRSFLRHVTPYGDIIEYFQYSFLRGAEGPLPFTTDEIIYIQERPSSRSPYGTSKLEVIKDIVDLMMAVKKGHRAEQENGLYPGGVINHASINDVEELRRRSALYESQFKGESNRGRWLVTGGEVVMTPIATKAGDSSWIAGCEFYQQEILSIFKVPRTILGFTSSETNRATSVSQGTAFKRYGVTTMMTLLENIFTREIVKKYYDDRLVFRFMREVDLTDESIRADIDQKQITSGIRTANELRVRDGFEEIEEEEIDQETGMPISYEDNQETPEETAEKGVVDITRIEDASAREQKTLAEEQERAILENLHNIYGV